MSDREMRELLEAVIDDIESGRVEVRRAGRLGRLVGTGLVAATVGLSAGCTETAVGTSTDATTQSDAATQTDARVDAGAVDLYGVWIEDAAVEKDAEADAVADAEVDAEIFYPPYAAPPIYDFTPA